MAGWRRDEGDAMNVTGKRRRAGRDSGGGKGRVAEGRDKDCPK